MPGDQCKACHGCGPAQPCKGAPVVSVGGSQYSGGDRPRSGGMVATLVSSERASAMDRSRYSVACWQWRAARGLACPMRTTSSLVEAQVLAAIPLLVGILCSPTALANVPFSSESHAQR